MSTRPRKKRTAKPAEAKPKPPEAPLEKVLRFVAHGYQFPMAMAALKAEAEQYHGQWNTPKLKEARALIDDILRAREPYFRDNPKTQLAAPSTPTPPVTSPANAESAAVAPTKRKATGRHYVPQSWELDEREQPAPPTPTPPPSSPPSPPTTDRRVWLAHVVVKFPRAKGETASAYARRLLLDQPASLKKPWAFETLRKRV